MKSLILAFFACTMMAFTATAQKNDTTFIVEKTGDIRADTIQRKVAGNNVFVIEYYDSIGFLSWEVKIKDKFGIIKYQQKGKSSNYPGSPQFFFNPKNWNTRANSVSSTYRQE